MTTPSSPDGYTSFEQYSFPKWVLPSSMTGLLAIAGALIFSEAVTLFPKSNIEFVVSVGIGVTASLFIHESLHYLVGSVLGYDPIYLWPNAVYVPDENLNLLESSVMLLAPQLLSVLYAGLLVHGLNPGLELVVGWGLVLNLGGAASDVSWVLRRITWPTGTRVVVGDDHQNYVAFPKDSS